VIDPQPQQPPKMGRPPKVTDELVTMAEVMLARRCHKSEVKAALKAKGLSARSCEKAITLAKARLVEATDKLPSDHKNEAYRFYDSVLRDPFASTVSKVKAQERIDKLLGLESPLVLQHTGAGGGPIKVDAALKVLTTEELEQLERLAAKATGPTGDPAGVGGAKP
jgi:hypothetical protein